MNFTARFVTLACLLFGLTALVVAQKNDPEARGAVAGGTQVCPAKVRVVEVRHVEVRLVEVGPGEDRLAEIGPEEIWFDFRIVRSPLIECANSFL